MEQQNTKEYLSQESRDTIEINAQNEDDIEEEVENTDPFDPSKVDIKTKVAELSTLLRRFKQGTLNLAPEFQREAGIWKESQRGQLIESILLKIPLPMFYISADDRDVWSVVDGIQRLTTLKDFILADDPDVETNKKYQKLKGLEFWREFEGKTYKELDEAMQNRLLETELSLTIIEPGNPAEVKINVFKRINTQGAPLTKQEIRHALYQGKSTKFLEEASTSETLINAVGKSVVEKDKRMKTRELITRYLAFKILKYNNYKHENMDFFLAAIMQIINFQDISDEKEREKKLRKCLEDHITYDDSYSSIDINKIKKEFETALKRAKELFGKHAFRISSAGQKRTPINMSLFEVWSVVLSNLTEAQFTILINKKQQFLDEYKILLDRSQSFITDYVGRDSHKKTGVDNRYMAIISLLKKLEINYDT